MARHSHWHNIQLNKGKADKKRAKVFGRFTRAIILAAKEGGGDPNFNVRLRVAVEAAKEVNVPRDNIERAIARGTGTGEGGAIEQVAYEAYAPGRIAVMIVCGTDNRNRTSGEVKNVVTKYGGSLVNPGTFAFLFEKQVTDGSLAFIPKFPPEVTSSAPLEEFLGALDDLDDVDEVFINAV